MIHPEEIQNILSNKLIFQNINLMQPFICNRKNHAEVLEKICVDPDCETKNE